MCVHAQDNSSENTKSSSSGSLSSEKKAGDNPFSFFKGETPSLTESNEKELPSSEDDNPFSFFNAKKDGDASSGNPARSNAKGMEGDDDDDDEFTDEDEELVDDDDDDDWVGI